ncbi:MarR family winged helix-turn-helix transcriptional regulator [Anaerolentibacter hominis]|uniref:MarR family winged helix-turn-helix transcriptional regulator n=1 Tax=Anaerolentibacter hominis TaxID=3079009 RepID=UPI0031B847A7
MEREHTVKNSLEEYRAAYKDLDRIWSLFSKACGLSDAEYWALLMVWEGCTTQSQISEAMYMSKQTVHSALKQLVKKGIVRLEIKETNMREKQIVLTDTGRPFAQKYIGGMLQLEENVWAALSEEEREQLITLSKKYNSLLEANLQEYLDSESI